MHFGTLRALDLREGFALVRRCCSPSGGKHLITAVGIMVRQHVLYAGGVLLWRRRGRENLEPNRQHLGPVHSYLPGAALIRKKDDIIIAFIDVAEQGEKDIHGLTHLRRIILLCAGHPTIKKPEV